MKVYYCNSFLETAYYVRCMLPLQAGGWDGDRTSMYADRVTPEVKAKAVLDADIVVFHRPNDDRSLKAIKMLKEQGKKIVVDNDDSYKHTETKKWAEYLARVNHWLDESIKMADLVTCSTEFLAKEYRELNPNVVVLPNCVSIEDWPEEPQRNETDKVRIGLVGSVALNGDFEPILPYLNKLKERSDVQLVLFALPPKNEDTVLARSYYTDDYKFWESMNIEWQPFVSRAEYVDMLDNLKLDLMVIPRRDDYFNHCKSNLKFLEASMLKIPVIAQGFPDNLSPYEANPNDASHMVIIKDNSQWETECERLIADKELRLEMGEQAYQYVVEKYDIEKNIHLWSDAYRKLLSS